MFVVVELSMFIIEEHLGAWCEPCEEKLHFRFSNLEECLNHS